MTAQKGEDVILKIGDGGNPIEVFADVGGLRDVSFTLSNKIVEASDLASGSWRKLLSGAGVDFLSISGNGYFTDVASEEILRGYAFAATTNNYELHFGNGDKLTGAFLVASYLRSGDMGAQEDFAIGLESAGEVTFVTG